MNDKTKHRLIVAAIIAAIILFWVWMRKTPVGAKVADTIQKVASDLGLPDLGLIPYRDPGSIDYGDDLGGGYVPATMPGVQQMSKGYSACNFCLQSTTTVTTPAPPIQIPPQPTPAQIRSYPPPRNQVLSFGSSGGSSTGRSMDIRTPQGALALGMGYMGGI